MITHLCHPERSEGPPITAWITQTFSRNHRSLVRSLACARDDTAEIIEEMK